MFTNRKIVKESKQKWREKQIQKREVETGRTPGRMMRRAGSEAAWLRASVTAQHFAGRASANELPG